jgi:hypothetical protein
MMRHKFIDRLVTWIISIIFLATGILYQFRIIAEHYIFGVISYVIFLSLLIIMLVDKIKIPKKNIVSILTAIITFITVIGLHFYMLNNHYSIQYKRLDDGIKITGYTKKISNGYSLKYDIEIPSEIKGKEIKVIGANAFKNSYFHTLILPDSIEVIEEYAFFHSGVYSLELPLNIKTIGKSAFEY